MRNTNENDTSDLSFDSNGIGLRDVYATSDNSQRQDNDMQHLLHSDRMHNNMHVSIEKKILVSLANDGSSTSSQIAKHINQTRKAIQRQLVRLKTLKRIYISGWEVAPNNRIQAKYSVGNKPDVPKAEKAALDPRSKHFIPVEIVVQPDEAASWLKSETRKYHRILRNGDPGVRQNTY
jgi:hypothetical protein